MSIPDAQFKQLVQKRKERDTLIHILRNPSGWSEDTVRDARQKAAEELERLWLMEQGATSIARALSEVLEGAA